MRALRAVTGLVLGLLLVAGTIPAAAQAPAATFSLPIIDNARMWPIVGGLPNLLAPWIAPHGPEVVQLFKRLEPPSREHWLGTDEYGRDVLTRLLYGGRVSLAVALWSMAASIVIGVAVGRAARPHGGVRRGPRCHDQDVARALAPHR